MGCGHSSASPLAAVHAVSVQPRLQMTRTYSLIIPGTMDAQRPPPEATPTRPMLLQPSCFTILSREPAKKRPMGGREGVGQGESALSMLGLNKSGSLNSVEGRTHTNVIPLANASPKVQDYKMVLIEPSTPNRQMHKQPVEQPLPSDDCSIQRLSSLNNAPNSPGLDKQQLTKKGSQTKEVFVEGNSRKLQYQNSFNNLEEYQKFTESKKRVLGGDSSPYTNIKRIESQVIDGERAEPAEPMSETKVRKRLGSEVNILDRVRIKDNCSSPLANVYRSPTQKRLTSKPSGHRFVENGNDPIGIQDQVPIRNKPPPSREISPKKIQPPAVFSTPNEDRLMNMSDLFMPTEQISEEDCSPKKRVSGDLKLEKDSKNNSRVQQGNFQIQNHSSSPLGSGSKVAAGRTVKNVSVPNAHGECKSATLKNNKLISTPAKNDIGISPF